MNDDQHVDYDIIDLEGRHQLLPGSHLTGEGPKMPKPTIEERMEAKLLKQLRAAQALRHAIWQAKRDGENDRAQRGRVMKRRKTNVLGKASRKRNRA